MADTAASSTISMGVIKDDEEGFGRQRPFKSRQSRMCDRLGEVVAVAVFCLLFVLAGQLATDRLPTLGQGSEAFDSELHARCVSFLQPENTTYTSRLERLSLALKGDKSPNTAATGRAAWIAEPGPSVEYFLGTFASRDWHLSERPFLIAVTPSNQDASTPNITFLTPEFEKRRAQLISIPDQVKPFITWVSWQESDSAYDILANHLGESASAMVFDGQVRSFVAEQLRAAAGHDGAAQLESLESMKSTIVSIRERKDAREVELLRCANQKTLHAIRQTRKRMRLGIAESRTRAILEEEMSRAGLEGGNGLVLFGENAALPHGSGTDRKLGREDLILIDAGGKWGGYTADITRTFGLEKSRISKKHIALWEAVRRAQYAPYQLLKASNATSAPRLAELDVAAREVVSKFVDRQSADTSAGPDFGVFTHRLGHGIGIEGHESPYLVQGPQGDKRVQTGFVFSLEPGIYIPAGTEAAGYSGIGVRLEDCFVVTENKHGRLGGQWLSGPVSTWGDI